MTASPATFAPAPAAGLPTHAADAPATEATMAAYYVKRAAYYERVYHRPERQVELRALEAWIGRLFAGRRVLEVAAGTGWWTPHGAAQAADWLATDLNPETLALARAKPMPAAVHYAVVDAYGFGGLHEAAGASPKAAGFSSEAAGAPAFDAAFAGCWWSHVPLQRLSAWLDGLHAQLAPGARVVMLDNRFTPAYSTPLARRDAEGNTYQRRTLDDGSSHEVVKNYPDEAFAARLLGARARHLQLIPFTHYWVMVYTLAAPCCKA